MCAEAKFERLGLEPVSVQIISGGRGLVWDADGAWRLRQSAGLVGTLVGTLPEFSQQNVVKGLPLLLSHEELSLGVLNGWLQIVSTNCTESKRETHRTRGIEGERGAEDLSPYSIPRYRATDHNNAHTAGGEGGLGAAGRDGSGDASEAAVADRAAPVASKEAEAAAAPGPGQPNLTLGLSESLPIGIVVDDPRPAAGAMLASAGVEDGNLRLPVVGSGPLMEGKAGDTWRNPGDRKEDNEDWLKAYQGRSGMCASLAQLPVILSPQRGHRRIASEGLRFLVRDAVTGTELGGGGEGGYTTSGGSRDCGESRPWLWRRFWGSMRFSRWFGEASDRVGRDGAELEATPASVGRREQSARWDGLGGWRAAESFDGFVEIPLVRGRLGGPGGCGSEGRFWIGGSGSGLDERGSSGGSESVQGEEGGEAGTVRLQKGSEGCRVEEANLVGKAAERGRWRGEREREEAFGGKLAQEGGEEEGPFFGPPRVDGDWTAQHQARASDAVEVVRGGDDVCGKDRDVAGPSGSGGVSVSGRGVLDTGKSARQELLLMAVFSDLHARGFVVTSGIKFGCDFLVYPGDPSLFHSKYAVRVVGEGEDVSLLVRAASLRVAQSTRKTLVFATVDVDVEGEGEGRSHEGAGRNGRSWRWGRWVQGERPEMPGPGLGDDDKGGQMLDPCLVNVSVGEEGMIGRERESFGTDQELGQGQGELGVGLVGGEDGPTGVAEVLREEPFMEASSKKVPREESFMEASSKMSIVCINGHTYRIRYSTISKDSVYKESRMQAGSATRRK